MNVRNIRKQTIALIESLDTKSEEAVFAKALIESEGFGTLIVDISTKGLYTSWADITPLQILERGGIQQTAFESFSKPERIAAMGEALKKLLPELYAEGYFNAVITIGGGQNANMAAPAMKLLPFGVPKVVASSLACGVRTMEQYVGEKDIFVIPTVADIAGLNTITKTVIHNVCGAAMGMLAHPAFYKREDKKRVLAATILGVTTRGTEETLKKINRNRDYEVVVFHANGVGGRCMEALMDEGRIDAVLDMNLHEITCEMLGGYCSGAVGRLNKAIEKKLPMVVVPGALDMVDYFINEQGSNLPEDIDQRQKVRHNPTIWHCKVYPEEGRRLAQLVCERLNKAAVPVTLIVPTKGFCETSAPGRPLYDPKTDEVMVETFQRCASGSVRLIVEDFNICDRQFSEIVAQEFERLVRDCF